FCCEVPAPHQHVAINDDGPGVRLEDNLLKAKSHTGARARSALANGTKFIQAAVADKRIWKTHAELWVVIVVVCPQVVETAHVAALNARGRAAPEEPVQRLCPITFRRIRSEERRVGKEWRSRV